MDEGRDGAVIAATLIVLTVFAIDTFQDDPSVFVAMVGMVALSVVLESTWKSRIRTARAVQDASL